MENIYDLFTITLIFSIIAFVIRAYYLHLLKVKENECNSSSSRFADYEKETRKIVLDFWSKVVELETFTRDVERNEEALKKIKKKVNNLADEYFKITIILPNNIQTYFGTFLTNLYNILPRITEENNPNEIVNHLFLYISTEMNKLSNLIRNEYGLLPIKIVNICPTCKSKLFEDITNNEINCIDCGFKEDLRYYNEKTKNIVEYKIFNDEEK